MTVANCGARPFERVVKWGVTREDYAFFARSPARIRSVPGLGNDLKRGPAARGPIMWMKNGGWFRGAIHSHAGTGSAVTVSILERGFR